MNRRQLTKVIRLTFAAAFIGAVAISFQNCGKAGFNNTNDFDSIVSSSGDPSLQKAPLPIDARLNQIAYMSCPLAGSNAGTTDTLDTPYFTLRFGSFDNSSGFTFSGGPQGGVGISAEAIKQIKKSYPSLPPEAMANYIKNHPATANASLAGAIIMRDRSAEYLSVAPVATTVLDTLSTAHMSSAIASGQVTEYDGNLKRSFFPQASAGRRSLIGSLRFGSSEQDVEQFRNELRNNHYLFLGLVDDKLSKDGGSIISNLESPDNDVLKRLHGKGYELFFNPASNGSDPHLNYPSLMSIKEVDISPSDYNGGTVNPTYSDGQVWSCFSLAVVRDVDRKYYTTTTSVPISGYANIPAGSWVPPREVNSGKYGIMTEHYIQSNGTTGCLQAHHTSGFKDVCGVGDLITWWNAGGYFKDIGGVPAGTLRACPPQPIADVMTHSYSEGRQQKDILKIARRFLPADQWDINLDYNCAVPKAKVTSGRAKCYASGDKEQNYYIQYDTLSAPCGSGKNECASYVSICYRTK